MPVTVSYPGVYVQEEASGARAIAGVATSVAAFVGMAERGRMDTPVRLFSVADFEREYGPTTTGELAMQVRQFFLNGGGEGWVCRIADGDVPASVTLLSEAGATVLDLAARDPGLEGNLIRAEIDYDTASPEQTFNLTVYRSRLQPDGTRLREAQERYTNLSMDPAAGNSVATMVNGPSTLVTATIVAAAGPASGVSVSGLVLPSPEASVGPVLDAIVTATARSLRIAVGSNPPVTAVLTRIPDIAGSNLVANIAAAWQGDINLALSSAGIGATVTVEITGDTAATGGVASGRLLRILSNDGAVTVSPASGGDASLGLMLGAGSGGLEGSTHGDNRPAPTGLAARTGTSADGFAALRSLAGQARADIAQFGLTDDSPDSPHAGPIALGAGALYEAGTTRSLANLRGALDAMAAAIAGNVSGRWTARRHGLRLVLTPTYGTENTGPAAVLTSSGAGAYDIGGAGQPFDGAATPANVAAFTVGLPGGIAGAGTFQTAAVQGLNGNAPQPADYTAAYVEIDREVPIFNLLMLPRAEGQTDDDRQALWGAASAFCATKRAFLLVDPRSDWTSITAAEQGADQIRIGVETRNAACWWPRIRVADGSPTGRIIDPAGSVAGVMARTDGNRGVWKAAAGLEATVRGVTGLERLMTDPENGVINPKALNAIRLFPSGVVVWGARTLVGFDGSGNVDDKYIPVRRTMLFIEESLYRGLRFAVFEPNDEPLWAQIRLAAGSFMNGLFRQGAFAGAKASDAYFVLCDSTTTTANDINLGIVNVIVGFAPLKPAEFVVLTVKQIAGQVAV